jgi:hypothetical protein
METQTIQEKAEMYINELNGLFNTFNNSKISLMQKLCSHLEVDISPYGTTEDIYCYIEYEMEGFLYKSDVIEFKREIEYFLDIILDLTFNKYDVEKWKHARIYEKLKIELLNNDEAGGEEIDNEQVIIYENIIKEFNIVYDYRFDNLFSYYTKYVNKIFNEFKYKKTKIIQDASDIFDCSGETIDDNREYILLLFLYQLSNESIKEEIIKQEKTKSLLYLLKSKKLIHDNIRYDIKQYL